MSRTYIETLGDASFQRASDGDGYRLAVTALTCPYCKAFADFPLRGSFESLDSRTGARRNVAFWTCATCGMPITGPCDAQGNPVDPEPKNVASPEYPDVPPSIAADSKEAHRCFGVKAYRATAAMARRAIQSSAYDKGAPKKRLADQIKWLAEERHITPQMEEVADQLRVWGNEGAHPSEDGLEDVDEEKAADVLRFLDDFLRFVYEIPADLERIKQRRQTGE